MNLTFILKVDYGRQHTVFLLKMLINFLYSGTVNRQYCSFGNSNKYWQSPVKRCDCYILSTKTNWGPPKVSLRQTLPNNWHNQNFSKFRNNYQKRIHYIHMYVCMYVCMYVYGLPWWLSGKESAVQETWVWSLGWEDPLGEGMAIHSSTLAWRILGQRSLVGGSPQGQTESDMTAANKQQQHHFQMLSIFTDWDIGSQGLSVWIRSQKN